MKNLTEIALLPSLQQSNVTAVSFENSVHYEKAHSNMPIFTSFLRI